MDHFTINVGIKNHVKVFLADVSFALKCGLSFAMLYSGLQVKITLELQIF